MPKGKGTYGSKVGRPKKKMSNKGLSGMRKRSKTGGALGNVSNIERQLFSQKTKPKTGKRTK